MSWNDIYKLKPKKPDELINLTAKLNELELEEFDKKLEKKSIQSDRTEQKNA